MTGLVSKKCMVEISTKYVHGVCWIYLVQTSTEVDDIALYYSVTILVNTICLLIVDNKFIII